MNTQEKVTGLMVEVMGSDCTNAGITSGKSHALLILGTPLPFSPSSDMPALELKPRRFGKVPMAVPLGEKGYPMFGGHWIYSSDSRFPFEHPIPVHDRFEHNGNYGE